MMGCRGWRAEGIEISPGGELVSIAHRVDRRWSPQNTPCSREAPVCAWVCSHSTTPSVVTRALRLPVDAGSGTVALSMTSAHPTTLDLDQARVRLTDLEPHTRRLRLHETCDLRHDVYHSIATPFSHVMCHPTSAPHSPLPLLAHLAPAHTRTLQTHTRPQAIHTTPNRRSARRMHACSACHVQHSAGNLTTQ